MAPTESTTVSAIKVRPFLEVGCLLIMFKCFDNTYVRCGLSASDAFFILDCIDAEIVKGGLDPVARRGDDIAKKAADLIQVESRGMPALPDVYSADDIVSAVSAECHGGRSVVLRLSREAGGAELWLDDAVTLFLRDLIRQAAITGLQDPRGRGAQRH